MLCRASCAIAIALLTLVSKVVPPRLAALSFLSLVSAALSAPKLLIVAATTAPALSLVVTVGCSAPKPLSDFAVDVLLLA